MDIATIQAECRKRAKAMEARGYLDPEVKLWITSSPADAYRLWLNGDPTRHCSFSEQARTTFRATEPSDVPGLFDAADRWIAELPTASQRAVQDFQRDLGKLTERAEQLGFEDSVEDARSIVNHLRELASRISRNALTHAPAE